jgi:hypothetical protein
VSPSAATARPSIGALRTARLTIAISGGRARCRAVCFQGQVSRHPLVPRASQDGDRRSGFCVDALPCIHAGFTTRRVPLRRSSQTVVFAHEPDADVSDPTDSGRVPCHTAEYPTNPIHVRPRFGRATPRLMLLLRATAVTCLMRCSRTAVNRTCNTRPIVGSACRRAGLSRPGSPGPGGCPLAQNLNVESNAAVGGDRTESVDSHTARAGLGLPPDLATPRPGGMLRIAPLATVAPRPWPLHLARIGHDNDFGVGFQPIVLQWSCSIDMTSVAH